MDSSNIQTTFFSKRWIAYALVIFSTVLNGIVATGFVNTSFGTLERRFGFSSTTLGVISGVAYLGTLAFTLPFSLMAQEKGAPKLRLIAIGLFFIGLGSVFYSLPHFIAGPVERLSHPTEENLCQSNQQSASLQVSFPYEAFFIVGNLFIGIGSAPFFPVGYTYLLQIIPDKKMFLTIFLGVFTAAPSIGYAIGGVLLKVDTDFLTSTGSKITEDDEQWIGAWWVGFPFSAAICWITALVLYIAHPHLLTNAEKEELQSQARQPLQSIYQILSKLPAGLIQLCCNPSYMLINFGIGLNYLLFSSLSAFMPKYVANQFQIEASDSALAVGILITFASLFGIFLGTQIVSRLKLKGSSIVTFMIVVQVVTLILTLGFLFYCPQIHFNGVTHGRDVLDSKQPQYDISDLYSECNIECNGCSSKFEPVCGIDGIVHYNPCFAGCHYKLPTTSTFHNCSCILDTQTAQANLYPCREEGCEAHIYFALLILINMVVTFLPTQPGLDLIRECAGEESETLATALHQSTGLVLGIIGPVGYGGLVDLSCLLSTVQCIVYDSYSLAINTMAFVMAFKVLGILIFGSAFHLVRRRLEAPII